MKKLFEVQADIGKIKKNLINPFHKNKYVDINGLLEQISPILEKHRVGLLQPLATIEGRPAVETILWDLENDKQLLGSVVTLPDLDDSQKMGSAITYFRRYSLISLFALEAEDDDGNLASGKKPKAAKQVFLRETEPPFPAPAGAGGEPSNVIHDSNKFTI